MNSKNFQETKINLYDLIDNFCENCTEEEWNELLNRYCIDDNEGYMGETRKDIEEAILNDYNFSDIDEKQSIINFLERKTVYGKYENEIEMEK